MVADRRPTLTWRLAWALLWALLWIRAAAGPDPVMDLQLYGARLDHSLGLVAELADTAILLPRQAEDRLWLKLTEVPGRETLAAIARSRGLEVRDSGRLLEVLTPARIEASLALEKKRREARAADPGVAMAQVVFLRYAAAGQLATTLRDLFEADPVKPRVVADAGANAVIFRGSPPQVEAGVQLVRELDRDRPQVLIEAFVVEMAEDSSHEFGTSLGLLEDSLGGLVGGTLGGSPAQGLKLGDSVGNLWSLGVTEPALGLGLLNGAARLRLVLTALEEEGETRILSNPRIYALDNEEAEIFQGDEVPYVTQSERNGTQTEFRQAGLRLRVRPTVLGGGELSLTVNVSKDTVDRSRANPPISRRELRSRLRMASGSVAMIGGIDLESSQQRERRVPWLSRIPGLGKLFKRRVRGASSTRLVVFIAPSIQ